jgi:hypothetical protein
MNDYAALFTSLTARLPLAGEPVVDKATLLASLPDAYRPLFDHDGLLILTQHLNQALPERANMQHDHVHLCGWHNGAMVCYALHDDEGAFNHSVPQPIQRVACFDGQHASFSPKEGFVTHGDINDFLHFVDTYFINTINKAFALERDDAGALQPSLHISLWQAQTEVIADARHIMALLSARQQQG